MSMAESKMGTGSVLGLLWDAQRGERSWGEAEGLGVVLIPSRPVDARRAVNNVQRGSGQSGAAEQQLEGVGGGLGALRSLRMIMVRGIACARVAQRKGPRTGVPRRDADGRKRGVARDVQGQTTTRWSCATPTSQLRRDVVRGERTGQEERSARREDDDRMHNTCSTPRRYPGRGRFWPGETGQGPRHTWYGIVVMLRAWWRGASDKS
jgi:hypothetical protein